jgi:hypothetical protein
MRTNILISVTLAAILQTTVFAEENQTFDNSIDKFKDRLVEAKIENRKAIERIGNEKFKIDYKSPFGDELHRKLRKDKDYQYITTLYMDLKNGINLDLTMDQDIYMDVYQKSNKLMMKYSNVNALKLFDFYKKAYNKYISSFTPNDLGLEYVVKHPEKTKGVSLREHPIFEFKPKQIIFMNNYTHLHLKAVYRGQHNSVWGKIVVLSGKNEGESGWVNLRYCERYVKYNDTL